MQIMCSYECAHRHIALLMLKKATKEAKADRKETKARLIELQPLSWHHKRTEKAVNAYIRARDAKQPCISCGTTATNEWDAGHFLSKGSNPSLRYDHANIHKQCVHCNQHKGGNVVLYRKNLINRIGLAEVERLEGQQPVIKWTREMLAAIEAQAKDLMRSIAKIN